MYESGSGSLCGREKDFSRHIDDKKSPWQVVFCHGFFCFLHLMIPGLMTALESHGMGSHGMVEKNKKTILYEIYMYAIILSYI